MSVPGRHNRPEEAGAPAIISPESELPPCSPGRKLVILVLVLVLLGAGVWGSLALFRNRPVVQRKSPPVFRASVRVRTLHANTRRPLVRILGTVLPARELRLRPAVSGTVVMVSPALHPGGRVRKGDLLLRLDSRDYELAVEQSRQRLEKARMDLRLEEGQQAVARREYELMQADRKKNLDGRQKDLVLRQPQLAKARAAEEAARLELEQAKLKLEKTRLLAPFDALVRTREVSVGSQVTAQSVVAELVGIDVYWVRATVPRYQLGLIPLPGGEDDISVHPLPEEDGHRWAGRIIGLLPGVEDKGLMARLLVAVDQPVQENSRLLLGSRVAVRIRGRALRHCFRLERRLVRPDNTVLLAGPDDRLEIRTLKSVFQDQHWVYVQEGLEEGERLIVSELAAPVAGMPLRIGGKGRRPEGAQPHERQ